jgi:hypothetical protein
MRCFNLLQKKVFNRASEARQITLLAQSKSVRIPAAFGSAVAGYVQSDQPKNNRRPR